MKSVRIHEFGGLDVLQWEDGPDPEPRPHQVLIKVDSAGVNYADLMRRSGGYPGPDLPASLGLEAAGTVTEVGSEVEGIAVGQRVMAMGPGGQAEYVAVNANFVFPYPETVDPVQAGGMPIVFLTAYHLLKTRGQLEPGHTVLVQAGASGVGTVAIQLAKAWGARVIATASTQEKLDLCRSSGGRCDYQLHGAGLRRGDRRRDRRQRSGANPGVCRRVRYWRRASVASRPTAAW